MITRWMLTLVFILLVFLVLPVNAHVPISADNNNDLSTALSLEKPTKSYAIYGHLHEAGEAGYFTLDMNAGDRLVLSLMTTGFSEPVPDMIIMSPRKSEGTESLHLPIAVPPGYNAELIKGHKPVSAEYEPFSPAAIYTVASYSKNITSPGTYFVAVISPADETEYSIAIGYLEEFSISEWILIPVNVLNTHLWEGQSIIIILTPFLAIIILGISLVARRERTSTIKKPLWSWLAAIAGLFYLGGASVVLVQMVRALMVTGLSSGVILTLVFALIPILLGFWALRISRSNSPQSSQNRVLLGFIGILGLLTWAGLIIGPVIAGIAALVPPRS
jgi:hypothetical protein